MKKPQYNKIQVDNTLFSELRKRVNKRVQEIPENRDIYIQIKAVVLPLLYFGLYFLALFNAQKPAVYVISFVLMGTTLVLIYLNLIHEAAHNNIFKSKKLNDYVLKIFDFVPRPLDSFVEFLDARSLEPANFDQVALAIQNDIHGTQVVSRCEVTHGG